MSGNVCRICGAKAVCVEAEGPLCYAHTAGGMAARIAELEAQLAEQQKKEAK